MLKKICIKLGLSFGSFGSFGFMFLFLALFFGEPVKAQAPFPFPETGSTATEGNHVVKTAPGELMTAYVTTGAVAGYFMIFDAVADPGDGAVTPKNCLAVAANDSKGFYFWPALGQYNTGIILVFSSTGCNTKTESATAWFKWQVQ